jgi:hypothetical protein
MEVDLTLVPTVTTSWPNSTIHYSFPQSVSITNTRQLPCEGLQHFTPTQHYKTQAPTTKKCQRPPHLQFVTEDTESGNPHVTPAHKCHRTYQTCKMQVHSPKSLRYFPRCPAENSGLQTPTLCDQNSPFPLSKTLPNDFQPKI